jgi:hypothetical protein
MKRNLSIAIGFMFLAAASFASAQNLGTGGPATDVLGAHLNYGRGCPACHAPHSGAAGNGGGIGTGQGAPSADTGSVALWGEDASPLYGQTIAFAGNTAEHLPNGLNSGATGFLGNASDVSGILMCLSCHDGNIAKGAMMKNVVYETLPTATYGGRPVPTLLGNNGVSGPGAGSYLTDHPVGTNAIIPCGLNNHGWDCTYSATSNGIIPGPLMTKFITNYGFFVSPGNYNNTPEVTCTTCHNQHLMNVVAVGGVNYAAGTGTTAASIKSGATGLTAGNYTTMFFIRAPYNPGDTNPLNNQNAQFCRQCHGGESNEVNGGSAGTTF